MAFYVSSKKEKEGDFVFFTWFKPQEPNPGPWLQTKQSGFPSGSPKARKFSSSTFHTGLLCSVSKVSRVLKWYQMYKDNRVETKRESHIKWNTKPERRPHTPSNGMFLFKKITRGCYELLTRTRVTQTRTHQVRPSARPGHRNAVRESPREVRQSGLLSAIPPCAILSTMTSLLFVLKQHRWAASISVTTGR